MAGLNNLDGVTAVADVLIDVDGAGSTAAVSVKCSTSLIRSEMQQDIFPYDTFCSGVDEVTRTGKRRTTWSVIQFVSSGTTYSAPGSWMALAAAALLTLQYDTGCTISGTPRVTRDMNMTQANGATAREIEGRFSGAVTVTWVVA